MKVDWSPLALSDLEQIVTYVAQDNVAAAFHVADQIVESTAKLADFPRIGRPTARRSVRELVVVNSAYVVRYRVGPRKIEIVRVLHGARRRSH